MWETTCPSTARIKMQLSACKLIFKPQRCVSLPFDASTLENYLPNNCKPTIPVAICKELFHLCLEELHKGDVEGPA